MFAESEKHIFEFKTQDGQNRFKDPLLLRYKYVEVTKGQIDKLLQAQQSKIDAEWMAADQALAVATAQVFGFKLLNELTGEGVTIEYLLDLLDKFWEFIDTQKKTTKLTPTGVAFTGLTGVN